MLAKASGVRYAFHASKLMFVLLCKGAYMNFNQEKVVLLSAIESILHNFEEVFPKEVPCSLPPIKGIEHEMDFILEVSLPNQTTYRTNPKEVKEIQRQVEKLLAKGCMCNSYVISA